ncbi:MAG: hypothetical protein WAM77_27040 [Xanthobacteraceae bacterium]
MPNQFVKPALRPSVYFYHIPKTGEMSLRSFLADQYPDADRCPAEDWRALAEYDQPALAGFRLFYGHLSANLKDYFPTGVRTATFLRSPVGRTISTIRHLMRDPSFHPMHERFKDRTLREAIYDDELMLGLQNAQTTLLSCDVPIEEMLAQARRQIAENRFVEMGSLRWPSSLQKALQTLEGYDFVGLMDHFKDSLWAMCAQFGFAPPEVMPELNRATDEHLPRDLDEKDIAHVRSFLADDIKLYDTMRRRAFAQADRAKIFSEMFEKGILTQSSGPLDLDLGRPFLGSGWYAPELHGDRWVRWSGPHSKAMIYLPIRRDVRRAVRVEFLKSKKVEQVDVLVEEQKVPARVQENGSICTVELDLPSVNSDSAPLVSAVTLDSRRVTKQADRNDSDLRALGLLLLSVKVA